MNNEKKSILFIDDEDDLRELVCEFMKMDNYNCRSANNGKEATKIIEEEKFDVVIADFTMPLMSGDEFLFWCRKKGIHVPIIFFTGALERTESEKKALQDCCCALVFKPTTIEILNDAVQKAVKRNHEFQCKGSIAQNESGDHFKGQHLMNP